MTVEDHREDLADIVASAALSVPGVSALHSGTFGEVATYLPGRLVVGVRIGEPVTEVHLILREGAGIRETADAVREIVAPLVAGPVDVYVQDIETS